jgi:thioesterase domain-containing protein
MFDNNPGLIQPPIPGKTPTTVTPLILIHDGGGTTYSYFLLGDLGRPVYGISNPRYESGQPWEGGMPEMAELYIQLIRNILPQGGPIILGGWSQGGLLSLEVAGQLAAGKGALTDSPAIEVQGIIMIDSVYTKPPPDAPPIVQHTTEWSELTKPETRQAVNRCFAEATRLAKMWEHPTWGTESTASGPPPVILLRSREAVPVPPGGVSRVDLYRSDRFLGWENYRKGMIVRVIDIPGHHYNVFALDHIRAVTREVKAGCTEIQTLATTSTS